MTLSTPHRGVAHPSANDDRQWKQMRADSGFMARLHERGSGLDDRWASGTDWSLVGSEEDTTVVYGSGIDKGGGADQKYGYHDDAGDSGEGDPHRRPHAVREQPVQAELPARRRRSPAAHHATRLVAAEDGVPGGHQGRRRAAEVTPAVVSLDGMTPIGIAIVAERAVDALWRTEAVAA